MCVFQPHLLVTLYKRGRLWLASWGWSHASKIVYCVGLREGRGFEWLSDYSYIILEGASCIFSLVLILLTPQESAAHLVQAAGCCKGLKTSVWSVHRQTKDDTCPLCFPTLGHWWIMGCDQCMSTRWPWAWASIFHSLVYGLVMCSLNISSGICKE